MDELFHEYGGLLVGIVVGIMFTVFFLTLSFSDSGPIMEVIRRFEMTLCGLPINS